MITGIYQSLIIHIIFVFHDVDTLSIEIKGNVSGLLGENGTEVECSYTKENVRRIHSVTLFAINRSSLHFDQIATYLPDDISTLLPQGQYLKDRVTLMSITQSSTKAVMIFNKLMCIDDTFYKCRVKYTDSTLIDQTTNSSKMSIQVQVKPSKPDQIIWMKVSADILSTTPAVPMYPFTSSSSTEVTTKDHETISTLNVDEQKNTTASTHSMLPRTDQYTTSSIPSSEDFSTKDGYRTTTYSIQQTTTTTLSIAEGDNITVVCTGDVGKPPEEHVFQKYHKGLGLPMTYTASETSLSEISENCSFYRTSNVTFQVTADDNNAWIRCFVNSSMLEPDMYLERGPIEVFYGASMPNITIYPNNAYYEEGKNTSIHLTCKSDGNPKPYYQWYKENNELISSSKNWTITDMNVTNSGVYTCKVSNTFNGDKYKTNSSVHIQIMNKDYIPTTQSSSTGSSSGNDKKEEKTKRDLGIVVGIVVAVVTVIIVVVVIIAYMRRKSNSPTFKNVTKSFDDSKPKPITEPRTGDYDYIALEGDAPTTKSSNNGLEVEDINRHNAEYLKKQEEEEKKKKESNTPPQPAVYAQVNEATKSKNKLKTETQENTDKQEEDPYAETQEDVYDKAGNSRHKENENVEHFDSLSSSKQNSTGDNKLSIQTSQVGSYANQGFEKDENRKVATVSPTVRSSSGSQNDEQTNSNRNSQSKKGYENIIGTDQTGISEEESSHRTAL